MNRQQVLRNIAGSDMPKILVKEDQSVSDIIKLIKYKHGKTASDYDSIADFFWKGNVYDTAEALWNFCKENITYSEESEESQTVAQPKVILMKGRGDCKHYSLFIGGVLDALNRKGHKIDWVYRFASYNPFNPTPGHVFIIVKTGGDEIWIDPVLSSFDYHKAFSNAIDKKITVKKKSMSGIVLPANRGLGLSQITGYGVLMNSGNEIGATGQQTGATIMAVSPALAVVPVVGWAAAAGGLLVGTFLKIFGSKYEESTGVRWLTQMYESQVLGLPTKSDNEVNQKNIAPSQKWFSYVLGVPIYDQYRFWTLKGYDPKTAKPLGKSLDQRANEYLSYGDVKAAGVTYGQAIEAAQIADTMDVWAPDGAWKGMTAAPSLVTSQPGTGTATGANIMESGMFGNLPPWLVPIILIGVLLLFVKPSKNIQHHGKSKSKSRTSRRRR